MKLHINLYADADFAGLWSSEDEHDPVCVKSRSGFIVTIGNVPLMWKSKLQTEIALSTMESEYIALSTSMRELVFVKELFNEVREIFNLSIEYETTISRVFEDNQACLKLASSTMPKLTPRSNHIAVKYHWFKEKLAQ